MFQHALSIRGVFFIIARTPQYLTDFNAHLSLSSTHSPGRNIHPMPDNQLRLGERIPAKIYGVITGGTMN